MSKDRWCGTVWLSSQARGALIQTANPDALFEAADTNETADTKKRVNGHWFDALAFSFHPMEPTYGRVDADGKFELRTIEK